MRILYSFHLWQRAILLLVGEMTDDDRFHVEYVCTADNLYDAYIGKSGKKELVEISVHHNFGDFTKNLSLADHETVKARKSEMKAVAELDLPDLDADVEEWEDAALVRMMEEVNTDSECGGMEELEAILREWDEA